MDWQRQREASGHLVEHQKGLHLLVWAGMVTSRRGCLGLEVGLMVCPSSQMVWHRMASSQALQLVDQTDYLLVLELKTSLA